MGLKGIKSLKEAFNFITPDIQQFLKDDNWKQSKSKPVHGQTTSDVCFSKNIGGNEGYTYTGYVTGTELILETFFKENGEGNEVFNEKFKTEEQFVEAYNQFVEWIKKNL